jgi:hypothetical protein
MNSPPAPKSSTHDDCAVQVLRQIALTAEELVDLSRQGFIHIERRGSKTIYRLRFRHGGKQRSYYLSAEKVSAVEAALKIVQQRVGGRRHLAILTQLASRTLCHRKKLLEPLLEAQGFHYHGQTVRRRRILRASND